MKTEYESILRRSYCRPVEHDARGNPVRFYSNTEYLYLIVVGESPEAISAGTLDLVTRIDASIAKKRNIRKAHFTLPPGIRSIIIDPSACDAYDRPPEGRSHCAECFRRAKSTPEDSIFPPKPKPASKKSATIFRFEKYRTTPGNGTPGDDTMPDSGQEQEGA